MRRFATSRKVVAISAVVGLLLGACSGSGTTTTTSGVPDGDTTTTTAAPPAAGGNLNFAVNGDPGSLDPHMDASNVFLQMVTLAYDPLVHRTRSGDIVSGLAETWEPSGLGYTFTLREGLTCSDGSPLTATDVADNIAFAGDPENGSAFFGAAIPFMPTVTADDAARTVTIEPNEPFPFLIEGLALFPIACGAGLADRDLMTTATLGTGPFELSDSTPGQEYVFTVRDGYTWGPDGATTDVAGFPDSITFKIIANETTITNQLIQGELNIAEVIGSNRTRLEDEGLFNATAPRGLASMFFNQSEGRLPADETLRRAVFMAMNLEEIMTVFSGGFGSIPAGLTFADPRVCSADTIGPNFPAHDPDGAAALLEAEGWVEGSDGVRTKDGAPLQLSLVFLSDPGSSFGSDPAAELFEQQLAEIGIDIVLTPGSNETLFPIVFGSGDWDISWIPVSRPVPSQLIPIYSGPSPLEGGLNFSSLSNPDYEAHVAAASQEPGAGGCPDWEAAEEALVSRSDTVALAETVAPTWGSGVTFEVSDVGIVLPLSLRVAP